jgi:hypothetical protein
VLDASGAPIPNVPVAITNRATNAAEHVTTTTAGEFAAPNLAPGTYRIEVTVAGFRRFVEDGITLTAGATVRTGLRRRLNGELVSFESSSDWNGVVLVRSHPARYHLTSLL